MGTEKKVVKIDKPMKIVIIGDSGVGKTSIFNNLRATLGDKNAPPFAPEYVPTEDFIMVRGSPSFDSEDGSTTYTQPLLSIWDIGGNLALNSQEAQEAFEETDVFLLVVDGTQALDDQKINSIQARLKLAQAKSPSARVYIVANKNDQPFHADYKARDKILGIANAVMYIPNEGSVFNCSGATNANIKLLFLGIIIKNWLLAQTSEEVKTPSLVAGPPSPVAGHPPLAVPKTISPKSSSSEPWPTARKVFLGNLGVAAIVGGVFFGLAFFPVGGFLVFGAVTSAFIGAAIITGAALAAWNLGCLIYYRRGNQDHVPPGSAQLPPDYNIIDPYNPPAVPPIPDPPASTSTYVPPITQPGPPNLPPPPSDLPPTLPSDTAAGTPEKKEL